MEREVGGGIGMGSTCKSMADSFQCMTKPTTIKKKKKEKKKKECGLFFLRDIYFAHKQYSQFSILQNINENIKSLEYETTAVKTHLRDSGSLIWKLVNFASKKKNFFFNKYLCTRH